MLVAVSGLVVAAETRSKARLTEELSSAVGHSSRRYRRAALKSYSY
jgi:hypothetical protein